MGLKRTKADALFSDYIRDLADWKCERCGTEFERPNRNLHCSHFHSRINRSTRFDKENAASLCAGCHFRLGNNPAEHSTFFLKRLGQEKYEELNRRAHEPMKVNEKDVVIMYTNLIQKLKDERKALK